MRHEGVLVKDVVGDDGKGVQMFEHGVLQGNGQMTPIQFVPQILVGILIVQSGTEDMNAVQFVFLPLKIRDPGNI